MGLRTGGAIVALGILVAMPAEASDKADFEQCDGRVHPGKQSDGLRGHAVTDRYSAFVRKDAATTIGACTRALASSRLLPTQTLRRVHLMRARAAAYLQQGDTAKAIVDLDAAEAAAMPIAGDRFYQRSMGVSLKLLRALTLARSGDTQAALPLARAAMEARPYSLQVQQVAATVLQTARPVGAASPSPWDAQVRLSPDSAQRALLEEAEIGNFASVLTMAPGAGIKWPAEPLSPLALFANEAGSGLMFALMGSLHVAYARAATGDAEGARRELAEVRGHVAALRPASTGDKQKDAINQLTSSTANLLDKYVETRARQIEARIAITEGRASDAIGVLVASPLPRDAATIELLTALKAATAAKGGGLVPDIAPFADDFAKSRSEELGKAAPQALLAPETPRAVVDYERARPNILGALVGGVLSMGTSLLGGISRTDGFRTTENPDGTIKVEFLGNTPSAALVQEMTLLRAAEVARAARKPGFVIVERKDFSRVLSTTRYGVEVSSTPQGYKTELTIRCVDAGAEPQRALDATAIIDALGPLYYEEKQEQPQRKRA